MATVYFTNNSDSGDGSFRDTLVSSSPGDTIAPDPNVNWGDETITISLSSPITWGNRSRTVTGGQSHRIRFDGQGTVNHINFSNSNTITFERCDFVRGYRETFGAMFQATNASLTIVFRDCLCAGNKSNGDSAAFNLSSNSSSYKFDVTAVNCVIAGDAQAFVTSTRATNAVYKNCTFVKNLSTPSSSEISTFSNCIRYVNSDETDVGFVNVPTTVYNAETWTPNLWQTWDARLKPGSTYLTGYDGEETTDFLGHTRKANGAVGAYEGSWLVTKDGLSQTVSDDLEVDYAELKGALTIADWKVVSVGTLYGSGGTVSATTRAYFDSDRINGLTFHNVGGVARGANITTVSGSIAVNVLTVESDAQTSSVAWDVSDDLQTWEPVNIVGGMGTVANSNALYVRAFDGSFHVSENPIPRKYYYNGNPSSGSFTNPLDWTLDKAHTVALTDAPTIAGCTFDCRK